MGPDGCLGRMSERKCEVAGDGYPRSCEEDEPKPVEKKADPVKPKVKAPVSILPDYGNASGKMHKFFIADDESKYQERYKAIVRNEEKGKESHEEYAAHPSTPSGYAWDTNPPAAAAAPAEKAEAAKGDDAKADAPKEEKKAAEPAAEAKKEDAAAPKKEEAAKKWAHIRYKYLSNQ